MIEQTVQNILDSTLLTQGILSSHLKRVQANVAKLANGTQVTINQNIYVVFSILNANNGFGDGLPKTKKPYININLYYTYNKTDASVSSISAILKNITTAFLNTKQFALTNDWRDLYDTDGEFRGKNSEYRYIGVF